MSEEVPTLEDHLKWQATPQDVKAPAGKRMTNSLFCETIQTRQLKKYSPLYTLTERPKWEPYWGNWLLSAKMIYVHSENEYEAALKLVSSIEHWNRLKDNSWFLKGNNDFCWTSLEQWREEQRQRKLAEVEGHLMEKAAQGNVQAIKTLIGMNQDNRGRPSKEETEGEKKKNKEQGSEYFNDHDRIMRVIGGSDTDS